MHYEILRLNKFSNSSKLSSLKDVHACICHLNQVSKRASNQRELIRLEQIQPSIIPVRTLDLVRYDTRASAALLRQSETVWSSAEEEVSKMGIRANIHLRSTIRI